MRFLGNKTRLLENIKNVISENGIEGNTFCDIFAGSGSVGDFFKSKYKIISNDYLYSLSIINKAKLLNKNIPTFSNFIKAFKKDPFEYLNSKKYEYESQYFITKNYSEMGNRQYFSKENSLKIDGIRIGIEDFYRDKFISEAEYAYLLASLIESVMGVSNTSGTYEAYLKHWDKRALKSFELSPLDMNHTSVIFDNEIYNEDSNHIIRELSGDILYIDPPYTVTDYSHAYHLLETLAKYDYPNIRGITGRRIAPNHKSKYTRKNQAIINFEDLIRQADFKHIMISYSTQALIPVEELVELLKKFAVNNNVKVHYFPYREYKNIRASKKGKDLNEVVIYFEKDLSIIKSPLNYTGSKDSLIDKIRKELPRHITSFVDAMGGAFNVGANIVSMDKIIYNEFLPHVYELIKLNCTTDKAKLLRDINKIISKFKLEKGYKDGYYQLRDAYNKDKKAIDLFVLHMYCFQNQMRFNNKLEFNTPVGNCAFNGTLSERIENFKTKTDNVELICGSYKDLDIDSFDKETIFYFDPPYFITSATYNDGKRGFKGWNGDQETELLDFIQSINDKGYKFMLSNVLHHKDRTNYLLNKWINTHQYRCVEIKNVGSKNQRNEILVMNYDWRES